MDSVLYAEFLMWKENPSLERSSAFLSRIYREDIGPCLSFTRSEVRISLLLCRNTTPLHVLYFSILNYIKMIEYCSPQLSQLVQSAVENNSLTIEPVAMSALPMVRASAIECGGPKWVTTCTYHLILSAFSPFTAKQCLSQHWNKQFSPLMLNDHSWRFFTVLPRIREGFNQWAHF